MMLPIPPIYGHGSQTLAFHSFFIRIHQADAFSQAKLRPWKHRGSSQNLGRLFSSFPQGKEMLVMLASIVAIMVVTATVIRTFRLF
jgi:hypothetical protein